jgi:hypothetical protein
MFLGWRDTQLDLDCTFLRATDGKTRCLPGAIVGGHYFSDAACTQRLALVLGADCVPPSYVAVYLQAPQACSVYFYEIAQVTGAYSGMIYNNLSGCTSQSVPTGYTILQIGTPVVPNTFVEMTETIE